MPTVERYRLTKAIPPVLHYLRASYALEIVREKHPTIPIDEWMFRARKLGVGTTCVLVSALAHRQRLLERLGDGFDVEQGSPAATIMARLAAAGVSERGHNVRR